MVNQNQLGWEGLTHADQRLAGGGNQFSLEPPDQGLCVGNVSPNDPSFGPEVVESVNDALVFYDAAGEQFTNPITIFGVLRPAPDDRPDHRAHSARSSPTPSATSIRTRSVGSTRSWSSRRTPSRVRSRRRRSSTSRSAPPARRSAATSSTGSTRRTRSHPNCPCFGDQPLIGADKYGFYVEHGRVRPRSFRRQFQRAADLCDEQAAPRERPSRSRRAPVGDHAYDR